MKPKALKTAPPARLKLIAVSEMNYAALKTRGKAGDSFNDVVTELLKLGGQKVV